jgi:methyl-accepting chemotaxis protein
MFQDKDKQMVEVTTGAEEEALVEAQSLARRAQFALTTSKYAAGAVAILAVSEVILWSFSRQYTQLLASAAIFALVTVGMGLYPVFHRRDQAITGFWLITFSALLGGVTMSLLASEATPLSVMAYIFTFVVGTLLLGKENGLWIIGVCILAYIADLILLNTVAPGWFPPLGETPRLGITFLSVFALLACEVILYPIVVGQEEHFRQSQRANLELEKRAATEREQREYLQATVEKYADHMAEVGEGNLVARLTFEGDSRGEDDPLVVLGHQLNEMTTSLQSMVNQVQEQREYLQDTVQEYVEYMAEVGQGNLAARLTIDGGGRGADDPLIVLGNNLNETTASLQSMITQIRDAASDLSSAAAEILAATTQQVAGASEQSTAISQTNTTVDEVRTIAEQSATRAQEVTSASRRTVEVSRAGQRTVEDTIEGMAQIKKRVEGIAENILALSEQTQQISEIIATVNEIAAQSNILALNASVEAARAGEQGRGFAVVAAEVRNLAEQSRQATGQVKVILSDIQNATNSTVMATEEATKGVDAGVQLAAQTREAIARLSGVIDESAQTAIQMVAGGQQQQSGIEQIALAMQNINQATTQNLASTRQAEKAAQDLDELARRLAETVEQYQL